MSGEVHVRFCESRGVRLPPATHLVVMVHGTRDHADALRDEVSSGARARWVCACRKKDEGLPHRRGVRLPGLAHPASPLARPDREASVYTYPSKKSLASVDGQGAIDHPPARTHRTLAVLLRRLNPVLRGWCNYFRHGVSTRTFSYVDHFAFWRIVGWLRKRHVGLNWGTLRPPLPPRLGDPRRRNRDVPARAIAIDALPLPGHPDPHTMDEPHARSPAPAA